MVVGFLIDLRFSLSPSPAGQTNSYEFLLAPVPVCLRVTECRLSREVGVPRELEAPAQQGLLVPLPRVLRGTEAARELARPALQLRPVPRPQLRL